MREEHCREAKPETFKTRNEGVLALTLKLINMSFCVNSLIVWN